MARTKTIVGAVAAFVATNALISCTHVDYEPELRQAGEAMQRATGVEPHWAERFDLQELRTDESNIVTLNQAVELALSNNRALRADLQVIGQAKADLVQAGLLSNPVLSMLVRFPDAGGRANLDFGLAQNLADLWLIPSRKRVAQALLQRGILSFTDAAIVLVTEVKTNYYTLQYQSLAADLQQQNLTVLSEARTIAQARFQAGDTTELDVNLIRSRVLEAELELARLRSDFRITQQSILLLAGVARAPDTWQPEPMPLEQPFVRLTTNETEIIEAALLQRLDAQAAHWEMESAVADFQRQRLRLIPSLSIGIAAERSERRGTPGRDVLADTARASVGAGRLTAPDIQSRSQRRRERRREIDLILGPSIEIPLPIFDQNQARLAKAQFRVRELQQRFEEVTQRVIEGVRSALTVRRLVEDRVGFFRDSLVPLQETNLQLAESAYEAGTESILAVLFAQEALIRTRLNFAAAVRDLAISLANLERQLAGRLPEFTLVPPDGP